jgi:hypothetical protein
MRFEYDWPTELNCYKFEVMKLPRPSDRLAGCVWLPRILAKARQWQRGELPPEYAARFGHASGVDGQFIAHFGLSREDILAAAVLSDERAAEWWLVRSSAERVAQWNEIAQNLGRPGYPMAERLPVALATTYKHLAGRGLATVFEVLEADEKGSETER